MSKRKAIINLRGLIKIYLYPDQAYAINGDVNVLLKEGLVAKSKQLGSRYGGGRRRQTYRPTPRGSELLENFVKDTGLDDA